MKYDKINSSLFIENRARFKKQMKANSIAIFFSNDEMPRSADQTFAFRQNPDLFYLSGIDQEQTILVMFPDYVLQENREILFVRRTSELIAIWEGHKFTLDEAREMSGVQKVMWTDDFDSIIGEMIFAASHVYLNSNENARANFSVISGELRNGLSLKKKFPLHEYLRAQPIMKDLRMIKSEAETALLQRACDITEKAFRRILKMIRPGVMEYEIEAEITHEFLINKATGHGYSPIIASGRNACVLHYIENNKVCNDGDVLLMDFGAEYANYSADITRCVPVNGKFTQRQKAVYNAVLRAHRFATSMIIEGTNPQAYLKEVQKFIESECIGLGLFSKAEVEQQDAGNPLFRKYFMHGVSHHLGLDVHDLSDRNTNFKQGMVLTNEPGIYILAENLGIRIENDILITADGNFDLMRNVPIEAEEIEDIMNSK